MLFKTSICALRFKDNPPVDCPSASRRSYCCLTMVDVMRKILFICPPVARSHWVTPHAYKSTCMGKFVGCGVSIDIATGHRFSLKRHHHPSNSQHSCLRRSSGALNTTLPCCGFLGGTDSSASAEHPSQSLKSDGVRLSICNAGFKTSPPHRSYATKESFLDLQSRSLLYIPWFSSGVSQKLTQVWSLLGIAGERHTGDDGFFFQGQLCW